MSKLYDVVIAGAGPVGLWLACELKLAGVSVLILEREPNRESPWKVWPLGTRGLGPLAVEAIYRRGLLDKFKETGDSAQQKMVKNGLQFSERFAGHFAGIKVGLDKFDLNRWKYRLHGPALAPCITTMAQIETVLTERAESLGVKILSGHGVTGIVAQDEVSVTVEAGENRSFRGRWLVGCDGGQSVTRKAAGFEFPGTDAKYTAFSAKCELEDPNERLSPGFNLTNTGLYVLFRPDCLHIIDFDSTSFDRTQEVTREHLQDALNRAIGTEDVKITKVHLSTSSTDRCKQAKSYRKGRVLLAGDSAHIHSPLGGQGINLGLVDANNLGWKLAATVRQEAGSDGAPPDLTLLDTYEGERHAFAERVLDWTRAQVSTLLPDQYSRAIRSLTRDFINTVDGTNLLIDRLWGLSHRYDLGDDEAHAHPLVGSSAPDFELLDGTRLGSKLESGRGLLLDFEDDAALKALIVDGKYKTRVNHLGISAKETCGLRALLIRPDGIVAWVTEESAQPDLSTAKTALERWFAF